MKFIWVTILIDKLRRCGDSRLSQRMYGRFRVAYPDGERSEPMDYKTATNYRGIFGGAIIHIKTNKIL